MGEITDIRNGLEVRLKTISGLEVYDHEPDGIMVTPAASIRFEGWTPNTTFGNATGEYRWVVTIRLAGAIPEEQSQEMDDYRNPTGNKSILAAIDGDATLGGVVDYTVMTPDEEIAVTDREQRADGWYYVQEFPLMTSVTR